MALAPAWITPTYSWSKRPFMPRFMPGTHPKHFRTKTQNTNTLPNQQQKMNHLTLFVFMNCFIKEGWHLAELRVFGPEKFDGSEWNLQGQCPRWSESHPVDWEWNYTEAAWSEDDERCNSFLEKSVLVRSLVETMARTWAECCKTTNPSHSKYAKSCFQTYWMPQSHSLSLSRIGKKAFYDGDQRRKGKEGVALCRVRQSWIDSAILSLHHETEHLRVVKENNYFGTALHLASRSDHFESIETILSLYPESERLQALGTTSQPGENCVGPCCCFEQHWMYQSSLYCNSRGWTMLAYLDEFIYITNHGVGCSDIPSIP